MAEHEIDPWEFSRKRKLGGSDVLIGWAWGRHSPIFLKLQESWSKVAHAAIEIATIYSVNFFISSSILLLLLVGQIVKTTPLHRKSLGTAMLGGS